MHIESPERPARQVATTTLAVVGFITLVALGIWLAVYSTRFVPVVINRISTAAVSLGSIFIPAPDTTLSVVPTPVTETPAPATTTPAVTLPVASSTSQKPVANTPPKTAGTPVTQVVTPITPATPYGLPDLTVGINAIGYLDSGLTDSFVTSTSTPVGKNPAVKFTVKNVGTNWSGTWVFSASIPAFSSYLYVSSRQQSLAPGDSIEYTLGFDQAVRGDGKLLTVTVNPDHSTTESNMDNNVVTASLTVL